MVLAFEGTSEPSGLKDSLLGPIPHASDSEVWVDAWEFGKHTVATTTALNTWEIKKTYQKGISSPLFPLVSVTLQFFTMFSYIFLKVRALYNTMSISLISIFLPYWVRWHEKKNFFSWLNNCILKKFKGKVECLNENKNKANRYINFRK